MKKWVLIIIVVVVGLIVLVGILMQPNLNMVESNGLESLLPTESSNDNTTKVTVTIDKDTIFYLEDTLVAKEELEQKLKDRYNEKENLNIILKMDAGVEVENAVFVMDMANKNNFKVILSIGPN